MTNSSNHIAGSLLRILALEEIEVDLFRGANESRFGRRLFGGQVLGQALAAASRTVPGEVAPRPCHSLHGYFLRPGDARLPVVYQVERIRDGHSFTTRRVKGIQNGEAIFSLDASFQIGEGGLTHQASMPVVPAPEALRDDRERARNARDGEMSGWSARDRPFDMRSAPIPDSQMENPVWMRFRQRLPDASNAHPLLLAYASDMSFVSTCLTPHRRQVSRRNVQTASLDHAMWFHRDFRVDEWILYAKETTTAAGARGFNRGLFFKSDGTLIASTIQEGLIRLRGN